jgi:hypothetical protein
MSFKADTYRVVIASPSDLAEEREVAAHAINEWNAQHAASEGVVLLPIRWETHAMPATGKRPQEIINNQLIRNSDVLVGLFWTKIGTTTGVAESGTVEEINEFVSAGKPAMLYFSSRPIDPNKIDVDQHKRLKAFKAKTYQTALVGSFASLGELSQKMLRDLMQQVRSLPHGRTRSDPLDSAAKVTELMIRHRRNKITPEEYQKFRNEILGLGGHKRNKAATTDPPPEGEVGPNGGRIEYLNNGDKVEWVKDEDENGDPIEWPMVLRRSDDAILKAEREFFDKVWYNRHYCYDLSKLTPKQRKNWEVGDKAAKKIERRYGKKNLLYSDFEWGMVNGKLSALRWVMGDEWDMLDT